jgi:hypothetical protein
VVSSGNGKAFKRIAGDPVGAVGDAMGNDIHQAWVNNNLAMEGIVHDRDGEFHMDDWGITWTRSYGFNQITHFPLKNKTKEEVLAYQFRYIKLMIF